MILYRGQTVCTCISELSTHNHCIITVPEVVTDCAPLVVITDLHTTFKLISTTDQSHITLWAHTCTVKEWILKIHSGRDGGLL